MRKPSLHERISIKGLLQKKGVPACHLVRLRDFQPLLFLWYACFRRPMRQYYLYR